MINAVYILNATTETGGASKSFIAMLKGLMTMGVKPTVVLPDTHGLYNTLSQLGVRTIVLNYRSCTFPPANGLTDCLLFVPRLVGRLYLNHRSSKQLTAAMKELQPDIIHTNVSVTNIGYNAAQALHIPHIYHIREYGDLDFGLHYIPSHRSLERQLGRPRSYSICITKDIQRHHKQDGKPTSRVIYNGIMATQTTMPATASGDYFLFAGRIEPAKGLNLLIEAYAIYAARTAKPLKLFIAGGSPDSGYEEKLKSMTRNNGTATHIIWLGEKSGMATLMRGARATIVPSRFEGFGRVMPEAMFNGCLAIGRNNGGTKEQMNTGLCLTGEEIALRFDNADELAAHLLNVTNEPTDCFDAYRDRAFHTVNTLYTTEANFNEVYNMYKEIL